MIIRSARRLPFVVTLVLLGGLLPAQAPLTGKAFLPADHKNIASVDLAAMRAKGIWEELEVSLLQLVFKQMEKESGFTLRALDRVTMVSFPGEEAGMASRSRDVRILEGNLALGLPESVRQNWQPLTIGAHDARQRGGDLAVCPRPELLVYGSESLVRPVLEGTPHSGLPSPDVMSLLSGRVESLAWFVMDAADPLLRKNVLGKLFPGTEWPAEQGPSFLCARLVATGDPDDPHLGLEVVVRHATDGQGLAISRQAMADALARLVAMPQLRLQKPLLQRIEQKQDRSDLVYSVDLGRVRDAVGHVAALGMLLLVAERVDTVQAVQAVPAVPVPAPKK